MVNLNGGPSASAVSEDNYKSASIFVFEIKLAGVNEVALPPVKPARIQGWCVKQQSWTIPGTAWLRAGEQDPNDNPWEGLGFLGSAPVAELDDIPCASEYAIDLLVEHQALVLKPNTNKEAHMLASRVTMIVTNDACKKIAEFQGEGGSYKWGTRCVIDECRGTSRTSSCRGDKKHCQGRLIGPTMANLRDARNPGGHLKVYAFKPPPAFSRQHAEYEAWGNITMTHWYRPGLQSMDCTVAHGTLQHAKDGG